MWRVQASGHGVYTGVGSACDVDGASVRGMGGRPGVGVGTDDGDADGMGDAGTGSLGVGGVGVMDVNGLVLAWVT